MLKELSKKNGIKFPVFMKDLRVLLTGKTDGPPIIELINILGKEKSIERLNYYVQNNLWWFFVQISKQIYLFMSFLADLKCLTLDCLEPSPELPSLLMFSGELLVLELSLLEMRLTRTREIGLAGNFFEFLLLLCPHYWGYTCFRLWSAMHNCCVEATLSRSRTYSFVPYC